MKEGHNEKEETWAALWRHKSSRNFEHAYERNAAHCSRSLCYVLGNRVNCKIARNEIKT
jgi:hypothetical protein